MNGDDRDAMLRRLGYVAAWVRSAFVSDALLVAQSSALDAVPDAPLEHHRWAAWISYRDAHASITDDALEAWLEIARCEPDRALGASIAHGVARWSSVTDAQLATVERAWPDASLQRVVRRTRELRTLARTGALAGSLEGTDAVVQRALLDRNAASQEQLAWLLTRGATRTIRHRANKLRMHLARSREKTPRSGG